MSMQSKSTSSNILKSILKSIPLEKRKFKNNEQKSDRWESNATPSSSRDNNLKRKSLPPINTSHAIKKTVSFTMLEKGHNHVTREYLLKLQCYNRWRPFLTSKHVRYVECGPAIKPSTKPKTPKKTFDINDDGSDDDDDSYSSTESDVSDNIIDLTV